MPSSLISIISLRSSSMPPAVPLRLAYAGVWTFWRTQRRRSRLIGRGGGPKDPTPLDPVGYIQSSYILPQLWIIAAYIASASTGGITGAAGITRLAGRR